MTSSAHAEERKSPKAVIDAAIEKFRQRQDVAESTTVAAAAAAGADQWVDEDERGRLAAIFLHSSWMSREDDALMSAWATAARASHTSVNPGLVVGEVQRSRHKSKHISLTSHNSSNSGRGVPSSLSRTITCPDPRPRPCCSLFLHATATSTSGNRLSAPRPPSQGPRRSPTCGLRE